MNEKIEEEINERAPAIEKEEIYKVLVNQEEQYSIWAANQETPKGWESVGPTGTKEVCLSYIKEVWTDMRPKSIR